MWLVFLACFLSFGVAALSGLFLVPFFRKLNFGATIYEDGPAWHKSKNGTPLMGGFMFILGTIISVAGCIGILGVSGGSGTENGTLKLLAGMGFALLNGVIGFIDDYIKAVKKQNEGLNPKQKMIMQFFVSSAFLLMLYLLGDKDTSIHFPFIGDLELWYFYYPIMLLVLIYLTNAVNLTDGVDGLCSSITVVFALTMLVIFSRIDFGEYKIFCAALAGGCMGFLIWNFHPAKIFMGDTGSMFLGGAVCAVGFVLHEHVILVCAAIVYILEALSVVIQVGYFKITAAQSLKKTGVREGKRLFKMTPIHHHFEKSGFTENGIVALFSAITLLGGILANLLYR
ncbi:MAG: phospho-N-acetylmuramoyl-pentapeptide-transferase [Oscillospiraceae bacterium]|nr:phospho-N-acetylmuramoyl-pentapeptide-transferase [Oscillospiraceae bacterium]